MNKQQPLTSKEKVKAHRDRKIAAGYKSVTMWVKPENERALKVFNDALEIGFIKPKGEK